MANNESMIEFTCDGFLVYSSNGRVSRIPFNAHTDCAENGFSLKSSLERTSGETRLTLSVSAESHTHILAVECALPFIKTGRERVFLNGYQSWTDTKEFGIRDRMKAPSKILGPIIEKNWLNRYADYEFQRYSGRRGDLHGATYGWVRSDGDQVSFFGSLDESTGFTFFYADLKGKTFRIVKDVEGMVLPAAAESTVLLDVFFTEGTEREAVASWFKASGISALSAKPSTGWTSWYNYYQNISEEIILGNLDAFASRGIPLDIFQIDDGYQTAVGDWLSVNDRFPNGMKHIADRIKEAGYTPGIWLAPFAGETKSKLFAEHRSWFITDDAGEPFATGGNWSAFYSLDIYNPEVRAYLKKVFDTVIHEWGFRLLKLDFLYGACIRPRDGKTRGRIMADAVALLRECAPATPILGCGVPLAQSFGTFEFCRIGTDIDLQWHNKAYGALIHREFPSTKYALQNSITRNHLDGHAFLNDPDVFLLRHTNIKLNDTQKKTIFYINNIFGSVLFTSDDIREYSDREEALYFSGFPFVHKNIISSSFTDGICEASFTAGNREYVVFSNQSPKRRTFSVPDGFWFRAAAGEVPASGEVPTSGEVRLDAATYWIPGKTDMVLSPWETVCLLRCDNLEPGIVAGSFPSAFPGTEPIRIEFAAGELKISKTGRLFSDSVFFVAVPADTVTVSFGGNCLSPAPVRTGLQGAPTVVAIRIESD